MNVLRLTAVGLGMAAFAGACSADDAPSSQGSDLPSASGGSATALGPGVDGGFITTPGALGGASAIMDLPEEIEDEESYRAPVATGRYLWSANPESGRVALIDVVDLSVQVLAAGLYPTHLSPVPGTDEAPEALVLNTGSSDATRFRVGRTDGGEVVVDRETIETHVGANRWSVSASGKWAVAWSGEERGETLDPTEGLQEITVMRLGAEETVATRLTVGYRPSQVLVSADDNRLIVVSEEGITLINLEGTPESYQWIDLGFDEENRDVALSKDGAYALVRRTGLSTVDLIDMDAPDDVVALQFSAPVTDVDLSPSGRGVAVIREKSELSTFVLADVIDDPMDIETVRLEDQLFGSAALTDDGEIAVLYTNSVANDRVNIVDLKPGSSFLDHRFVATQAPIYSVATSPDGFHAAVLAGNTEGKAADAFAVVSLRTERFPRVVGTGAIVGEVALGNDFGIVTASSKANGIYEAYLVELPQLSVSSIDLATNPLATGVITLAEPDVRMAYAAQVHPEGRVTFFDFLADEARTLTGFELSAEVVDE